ncbi:hypothetical protein NQD34_001495 [Periophthalmus magnuspinnatus]|nr:hypothetical protein NQD34_001495 [Periophthalmus magnuspinnatus]
MLLFFIRVQHERKTSRVNMFVLNLALTDLQFVLTLPFWAVDTALDFSCPFGEAMYRIVLSVTVMNMYASVFFLTAISLTRYWSLETALNNTKTHGSCSAKWQCVFIWTLATLATAPTPIFSTVSKVTGENMSLLRFPGGQFWLTLYDIQKIVVGFVLPMCIVSISYMLLIRVIRDRSIKCVNRKRQCASPGP